MRTKINTIVIGSDHAGFKLKEFIKNYLLLNYPSFTIVDIGTNSEESCDYPDFANIVANRLKIRKDDDGSIGILICGTGIGMSIAVNRYRHIRGALINDEFTAKLAREHNNANVLIFGARVVKNDLVIKCIDTFLATEFDMKSLRHLRRLSKIS